MSTDNNTGVQTRAMAKAQRMENEVNPEQPQGAPNPAMNPTVDQHKAKEEAIMEFVRQHGTITLDWYIKDLHNTRVGDLIKERLPLKTTEGRILFSCPPTKRILQNIKFRVGPQDRTSIHIPRPTRGHRRLMPAGTIRSRVPYSLTTRRQ